MGVLGSAVTALGGALVGGLLTSGSNIYLARWRTARVREASARMERREMRRAARLVRDELTEDIGILRVGYECGLEPDFIARLQTTQWDAGNSTLAGDLPDGVWRAVVDAYKLIGMLKRGQVQTHATPAEGEKVMRVLKDAIDALEPYERRDGNPRMFSEEHAPIASAP